MSRHKLWNSNSNTQRKLLLKYEIKKKLLKSFKKSRNTSYIKRYLVMFYMVNIPKNTSISYSTYRCIISGRIWSVSRRYGTSRFVLRNNAYMSNLPGLSRLSW